jgi:hypothetical protein
VKVNRVARADHFLIEASRDELVTLSNCVNETLEAIESWEFPIRVGASPEEGRRIMRLIQEALRQAGTLPLHDSGEGPGG